MRPELDGWQALRASRWLRVLALWLMPVLLVLLATIFAEGTPRQMSVAVIDHDHSPATRALVRALHASPALAPQQGVSSVTEGTLLLQRGEVLALVTLPQGFERQLRRGLSPELVVFYNSQYLMAGKLAATAVREAAAEYSARAGVTLRVTYGQDLLGAVAAAAPVRPQMTPLFNPSMSYAHFLATAIAPAMWQLVVVMTTLLALHWRQQQAPWPHASGERWRALGRLLWPISLLLIIQALLMLWAFHQLLGWRSQGHWGWLVLGLVLMQAAVQSLAVAIMGKVQDVVRALSLCAAYLAPAFAFMGVTFPRADMNGLARFWGNLMPSTHYMKVQIPVADQGAGLAVVAPALLALALFLLVLPLGVRWLRPEANR